MTTFPVSRTDRQRRTSNSIALCRPKSSHISILLRSNSGAVPIAGKRYEIRIGANRVERGTTDGEGRVYCANVPPGDYELIVEGFPGTFLVPTLPPHVERRHVRLPGCFLFSEPAGPGDDALISEEEADTAEYGQVVPEAPADEWEEVESWEPEGTDDE